MVTVCILYQALAGLIHEFGYDIGLFSLHSLFRGGAMAAYWQGLDQVDMKRQGLWTSNAFWQYITSSCAATLPLAVGFSHAVNDTASSMSTTASTSSISS